MAAQDQETRIEWQDLDDRFSGFIELLAVNGQYYWVDMACVERFVVAQPTSLLDQLWLPVELSVRHGPTGRLFMPLVYPSGPVVVDDAASEHASAYALGQRTDWFSLTATGQLCDGDEKEAAAA